MQDQGLPASLDPGEDGLLSEGVPAVLTASLDTGEDVLLLESVPAVQDIRPSALKSFLPIPAVQDIRPSALKSFLPIKYHQWRQKYVRSCKSKDGEGMLYVDYNADNKLLPAEAVTVSEAIGCVLLTWCI